MAIAENRVLLGVEKTKLPTKRSKKIVKKKLFLTKVVDYLKSDSYLFAPLINIKAKEEKIVNENKLVKQFVDYLMSDNYMYALVVAPLKPIYVAPKEPQLQIKRVTDHVSRTSITSTEITIDRQPQVQKAGHTARDHLPEKVTKVRQPQIEKETVENAIYRKYRPTAVPEGMFGSKIRKLC